WDLSLSLSLSVSPWLSLSLPFSPILSFSLSLACSLAPSHPHLLGQSNNILSALIQLFFCLYSDSFYFVHLFLPVFAFFFQCCYLHNVLFPAMLTGSSITLSQLL